MSYTPTTWAAGDTVTAAKLNKLEQGVASSGGGLVVHSDENGTLDKTWKQISDAVENGAIPYMISGDDEAKYVTILSQVLAYDDGGVMHYVANFGYNYQTDSENGYPSASGGGSGAQ